MVSFYDFEHENQRQGSLFPFLGVQALWVPGCLKTQLN